MKCRDREEREERGTGDRDIINGMIIDTTFTYAALLMINIRYRRERTILPPYNSVCLETSFSLS